jgi:phage gpG-like protein
VDYARIDVDNLHAVLVAYEKRGERAGRELGQAIGGELHAEIMEVFRTEGYGEWPGFADSTLDRRLKKAANPMLLQDTGVLVGSIQIDADDLSVSGYTNVPYAGYHISPLPRAVIPLRDFLAIDTEMFELLVTDMLEAHVTRPITDTEMPPSRGGGRAA